MSNISDFSSTVNRQRSFLASGATRPIEFRLDALRKLRRAIEESESKILQSLFTDLHKAAHEALASEISLVLSEIDFAIKQLPRWIKPIRQKGPRMAWPSRGSVTPDPRGVALILGSWNYPVQLVLMPLVGAIAAGCCTILKPSELAPHTADVIADLIRNTFQSDHVTVVTGGRDVAESLLRERFDSIFFTGGISTGRAVLKAGAEFLTPVTLELGGKCPCIVCGDAPMDVTARRIIWAKTLNAGQSCVAPDYVLVDRRCRNDLIEAMKVAITDFFGPNPKTSSDYGRIINRHRYDQLVSFIVEEKVAVGGDVDADQLYIAPTILTDITANSPIMQHEILGPVLPIMEFENIEDAISLIKQRPAPLAAYVFTHDRQIQNRCIADITCGGVCINDAIVHLFAKHLPFGGVGDSGIGKYHGKASFDNFTHYKTVLRCSTAIDLRYRYPPQKVPLQRLRGILRFLLRC